MPTIKLSKDITAAIPNAEYLDMGTNRATHSAEMIKVIRELMKKIS